MDDLPGKKKRSRMPCKRISFSCDQNKGNGKDREGGPKTELIDELNAVWPDWINEYQSGQNVRSPNAKSREQVQTNQRDYRCR